jgi:micrococcal nuclease
MWLRNWFGFEKRKFLVVITGLLMLTVGMVWMAGGGRRSPELVVERVKVGEGRVSISGEVIGGEWVYLLQNGKVLFDQGVVSDGRFGFGLEELGVGEHIYTVEACGDKSRRNCVSELVTVMMEGFEGVVEGLSIDGVSEVDTSDGELYPVVKVIDGDTIKVRNGRLFENVRFVGIDAPEMQHPTKGKECFGEEASAFLSSLLTGKQVKLERDESQDNRDKYDRLLRFVWLEDGRNVEEMMVREGYAIEYTYGKAYRYQELYRTAQAEAMAAGKGLWGACGGEIEESVLGSSDVVNEPTPTRRVALTATSAPSVDNPVIGSGGGSLVCDCGKSCGSISSCDEAYFQLNECGCSVRDNDKDGVPCEKICPGG